MRSALLAVLLLLAATQARAGEPIVASGARDGAAPAWTITGDAPDGWTADCCTYARAIGVAAVVYRGEWTGEPQRVMVLNVWPAKLPTLEAELAADRTRYHQHDPAGRDTSVAIAQSHMRCLANVYEGSDHIDDMVVFCDPDKASGVRLSWSMTLAANEPQRRPLLDALLRVVAGTAYRRGATALPASAQP